MNKKTIKIIIKVFIVICVLVMIYSLVNIVLWYVGSQRNKVIIDEIKEIVDDNSSNADNSLKKLKEKNNEIVTYLKVNNTNIDYPVVKGNDNKFYLKHNLYKEYSQLGWIFMDYHNKLDGSDKNIIIYGHNTKDGTMFGTLRNVTSKSWYENKDNHTIELVFEDKTLTYKVFSTYNIAVEDYYIKTSFKNALEFNNFVNVLRKRSVYNYNVDTSDVDSILTLSTCSGNGKRRVVLHAILQK